jgi:hypothetical protein
MPEDINLVHADPVTCEASNMEPKNSDTHVTQSKSIRTQVT